MNKEKFKKAIDAIGIPRLIVFCFFIAIVVVAYINDIDIKAYLSSTMKYWGMWVILVLAMVPTMKCGIGPNYGVSLGIVCGLLGPLLAIQFNITPAVDAVMPGFGPWAALFFAIIVSAVLAWFVGIGYGKILNLVKGSEMTVTTYIGYSVIYLMCIVWFRAPFSSGEITWPLGGVGVRNSVAMETSFGFLLNEAGGFNLLGVFVPTGLILFCLAICFAVYLFFRTKTGLAIQATGANPTFARASGIDVDKARVTGVALSTMLGAIGIVIYTQGFGYLQAYTAPLAMGFICVASVLIGGATMRKATIAHVIIGTFLYQGLIIFTPPVSNKLLAGTDISDTMRQIIQNGVILYALVKSKGGSSNE